jgi:hypothetical protein
MFVIPSNISAVLLCIDKTGLACCLYCTKSGWRCFCHFPPALAYNLHTPPSKWEARADTLRMSRTLLTNKNQETMEKHTLLTLLSQRKLALTARIAQFLLYTIIGATKN